MLFFRWLPWRKGLIELEALPLDPPDEERQSGAVSGNQRQSAAIQNRIIRSTHFS
jgi:hypothetical protein